MFTCVVTLSPFEFSACLFAGAPNAESLLLLGKAVKLFNEAVSAGPFPWIFPPAGISVNKTLAMRLVGISALMTMGQELTPSSFSFSLLSFWSIRNVLSADIGTQRNIWTEDGLLGLLARN